MIILMLLSAGAFELQDVKDPVTDAHSVAAVIGSEDEGVSIGCDKTYLHQVKIIVETKQSLMQGNSITGDKLVTSRFDQEPAGQLVWKVNNHQAWLEDGYRIVPYLNKMLAANIVIIRLDTSDGGTYDLTVPLRGKDAITQAVKACGDQRTLRKLKP